MKKDEKVAVEKKIKSKIAAKKVKMAGAKETVSKSVKKKPAQKVVVQKSTHGTNYTKAMESIDKLKFYTVPEAVKVVKETSYAKFDASVDLQVKLSPSKKNEKIAVRGTIKLPSGSPKTKKIVIASEDVIAELEKGKMNFDSLLTTPEMMPKLAKFARILGPRGLMPSPKSGTVTSNPEETLKELQSGLVEYKSDAHGIVHLPVGKKSWDDAKIVENIETILRVLPQKQIASINLSATMSPSVKIKNI